MCQNFHDKRSHEQYFTDSRWTDVVTARIRRDGEGNVFSLSTPGGGGYPYPIMLCNISQNAMGQPGGYPTRSSQGGVPCLVQLGEGYPVWSSWGVPWRGGTLSGPARGDTLAGGTLVGGILVGGNLPGGTQVGYPQGTPPGQRGVPR